MRITTAISLFILLFSVNAQANLGRNPGSESRYCLAWHDQLSIANDELQKVKDKRNSELDAIEDEADRTGDFDTYREKRAEIAARYGPEIQYWLRRIESIEASKPEDC